MKILLINPDIPLTFWSFKKALKFISRKAVVPPLGLLTVAAILPKDWEAKLVDMTTTRLRDRDIKWADYIFVTAMYIQRKSADETIERCQKIGKKVVAGGPLFTSIPEQYVHVDHLVLKEAELTLPLFIRDIQNDCPRKIYNTHDKADLSQTPIPLWDLAKMKKYAMMCSSTLLHQQLFTIGQRPYVHDAERRQQRNTRGHVAIKRVKTEVQAGGRDGGCRNGPRGCL